MDTALEYAYRFLPSLRESKHKVTSSATNAYNCLAWSLGDPENNWWPNDNGKWLMDLPEDEQIGTFVRFFGMLGLEEVYDWDYEPGVTKIAMFAKDSLVTHLAVQHSDSQGVWSSKIGVGGHDISHDDLFAVEGGDYGALETIFRYDGDIRVRSMTFALRKGRYARKRTKPTQTHFRRWYEQHGRSS